MAHVDAPHVTADLVVTVTPNASLDLTYLLADGDALTSDDVEVHRAGGVTIEASGKGVNVSRTLALAGRPGVAVLPAGGATGAHLADLLVRDGVPHRVVPVAGDTRVNTSVLTPGGPTTKINGPGAALSAGEVAALLAAVADVLGGPVGRPGGTVWVAVCGSLPPGVPASLVADLVGLAHVHGARCAVDTSGEALAVALEAGADLFAPNVGELAAVRPALRDALDGTSRADLVPLVLDAARAEAAARGCELLVSLGASGAVWSDGDRALHAAGVPVVPLNTAGAGDALLAGWLAGGDDPQRRLERAVAWGSAACLSATTVMASVPQGMTATAQ